MTCRRIPSAALLAFALALPADFAWAQQLEYGRLEDVFGEPVTQSATGKPERLSDTPMVMDVITATDIARSGARDLPTLLGRLPGINVIHGQNGTEELSMNGFVQAFGSRVMVMINGRQVYSDAFGEVFWSSLPVELDEIRQIEVVRGPQSALYGFDAVDGVINIVTFDPLDDDINAVRTRIGNHARRDASVVTTRKLSDNLGVRLTVADDNADDVGMIDPRRGAAFLEPPERKVASLSAGYALDDGSRLGVEASHSDIHQRSVARTTFYTAHLVTDSVKTDYTADTLLGRLAATAYFTETDIPTASATGLGNFQMDDRNAVVNVSDLFKIGADDSFRVGVEFRHDSLNLSNFTGATLAGDLFAGSWMWEHTFSPTLSMVNAARYDHFQLSRSGQPVSWDIYQDGDFDRSIRGYSLNSALIQKLGNRDSLRLSFGRGLELPSLLNYGQLARVPFGRSYYYYFGNPYLDASTVYEYRASWNHHFDRIAADGRISLFHNQTMHLVNTPTVLLGGHLAGLYTEGPGLVTNGAEFQIEHKPHAGLTWSANYTFNDINQHSQPNTAAGAPAIADMSPRHQVNAAVGYAWDHWEANVNFSYVSETIAYYATQSRVAAADIKAYATASPRLAWRPQESLTFELSAENLWSYRDNLVQRVPATFWGSVRITF